MTGPEHYQKAIAILDAVAQTKTTADAIAAAQVHATLALAAATALYDADLASGADVEYQAWRAVAGTGSTP